MVDLPRSLRSRRWRRWTRDSHAEPSRAHLPLRQVDPERPFDRLVGAHEVVVDLHLAGLVLEPLAERLEVLQVFLAEAARIDAQLVAGVFQAAELRPLLKRKLDLLRREDV